MHLYFSTSFGVGDLSLKEAMLELASNDAAPLSPSQLCRSASLEMTSVLFRTPAISRCIRQFTSMSRSPIEAPVRMMRP